jgi:hypothetical protein
MKKNLMFGKYLAIMGLMMLVIVVLGIVPMWLAYPPYGKAMLLGMPPMLFIAMTWMVGCWWAYDKERYIFMTITMGAIPIRVFSCLVWSVFVMKIPELSVDAFVFSMMIYWMAFTATEIMMIQEFSNSLPCTAEIEPKETALFPEFSSPPEGQVTVPSAPPCPLEAPGTGS